MDPNTLERARRGDERAFDALVAPHLPELRVHCYRMLGSLSDADDALQETLLAAWRGLAGFEGRASPRTWLYRIATRRCLNARRDDARRTPPEPVPPFRVPEPTGRDGVPWLQPCPDAVLAAVADLAPGPSARHEVGEAVELAFVAALQRVPPRQAAAVLLRDVVGFGAGETAELLGTSATVLKGLLQRARAGLRDARAAGSRPDAAVEDDLARRFAAAYVAGDVDAVVALLTDDAWLAMPPAPHRYGGRDAIAAFLRASFAWRGERPVALVSAGRANTHPVLGRYLGGAPAGLYVLAAAGERIEEVTRFHDTTLFARFGLPERLDGVQSTHFGVAGGVQDRIRSSSAPGSSSASSRPRCSGRTNPSAVAWSRNASSPS